VAALCNLAKRLRREYKEHNQLCLDQIDNAAKPVKGLYLDPRAELKVADDAERRAQRLA